MTERTFRVLYVYNTVVKIVTGTEAKLEKLLQGKWDVHRMNEKTVILKTKFKYAKQYYKEQNDYFDVIGPVLIFGYKITNGNKTLGDNLPKKIDLSNWYDMTSK